MERRSDARSAGPGDPGSGASEAGTPEAGAPGESRAGAAPDDPAQPGPGGFDLLVMDLEALRTTEHPVLAALVEELRARVAAPGSEALWGFDNAPAPGSPPGGRG